MKDRIVNIIIKIFWIFIIGSIFGFVLEMFYAMLKTHTITIRKGLIYGPFIQIYGIGAVVYYLLISKMKNPKEAFFAGMIMGGLLEYVFSFLQEVFFGTISWDYSQFVFSLNGRTSLLYCIYWGIIAVVFLKLIYPWFKKLDKYIQKKRVKIITVLFMLFMIFDISVSWMAGDRQEERRNNIPPKNIVDTFLDNAYPDEVLDKIYDNRIIMN